MILQDDESAIMAAGEDNNPKDFINYVGDDEGEEAQQQMRRFSLPKKNVIKITKGRFSSNKSRQGGVLNRTVDYHVEMRRPSQ